ncbi:MAG: DUF2382 domain-containing protein [Thermomicrobiales bacterium]
MDRTTQQWNMPEGTEVFGVEGDKVGKIVAIQPTYVVVEKGFFFPSDYYIPRSAIANFDGENVYLAVTKDEALNQQWAEAPPDYLDTEATAATTGGASATGTPAGPYDTGTTGGEHHTAGQLEPQGEGDTMLVPVHEEELVATKRPVEMGEVKIGKDVVEEERTIDVPVTEERVRVTRRAVDRDAETGELAFEEGSVDVPIRGEQVDVEKRTRVAEEAEVAKEQVQRTERVGGKVREERVHVGETGQSGRVADDLSARDAGYEGEPLVR